MRRPTANARRRPRRNGLLGISPLFVMVLLFVALSCLTGGISQVSLPVIFVATSAYALATTRGLSFKERIARFSQGAGEHNLLLMIWIFILAGAFASSAKATGAISATVDFTLYLLPPHMILAGIFLAACFVSLAVGTSVGTIVAIVPIAAELADKADIGLPMLVAAAVGGAFFGDNLSFISDTTIVSTRTQGCLPGDKFRANFRLVLPAAIVTTVIYLILGQDTSGQIDIGNIDLLRILPYLCVLIMATLGMNVLGVLFVGNLLTGITGGLTGSYDFGGWMQAVTEGIGSMGELIIISMLAGGLLELIRHNGGIVYLIRLLTRRVRSKTGAELSIGALVSFTNLCTANNTIAILSVGRLANEIAEKYGVDKRKSASILDTFSCCIQGLIPYGAQLLMAGGLSGISPVSIIPYLYYPLIMGIIAFLAILLRYPRKYS